MEALKSMSVIAWLQQLPHSSSFLYSVTKTGRPNKSGARDLIEQRSADYSVKGEITLMKILIVEDSKFLRLSMERALTVAGYEVISASDGEQAFRLAREHSPNLILLDIMLPRVSGPDALKALKKDFATASIPVMMLTSLSSKNAMRLEKDGAASFFEKSDTMLAKGPGSLLEAIDRLIKKLNSTQ
jgi:two-component system, cell cycle response regulator DivK